MNPENRRICVYSSTRADYGLLRGLLREIKQNPALDLQLIVSGMHLSPEFGTTVREIEADGFCPDERVEILMSGDSPTAVCKSMGLAMMGYGEALNRLNPDILVLLGDRFETFCMAAAAQVLGIPVAHIHGGETTQGAIDEAFRHSITKLSHLHFASCDAYARRIVQLGEMPERVFNVGALGVETILQTKLMDREALETDLNFSLASPFFMVTFHPVTLENTAAHSQFQSILDALSQRPEIRLIFTKANADTHGRVINELIDKFTSENPHRCLAVTSMGSTRYLSALKYAAAVIGNSSSGIIEAPSFKIPTINIGDRQKGRIQAESVLNCRPDAEAIAKTIDKALSKTVTKQLARVTNPYEKKETASEIAALLEKTEITGIRKKRFHDIIEAGR